MSNDILQSFRTFLTTHGYRLTASRETVFKLLLHAAEPQSMRELITKAGSSVDRVSVYRTVELFEKLDIVHRIYIGWKYRLELSDEFIPHHHHLSCLGCGKMIDIAGEEHLDEYVKSIAIKYGFQPRHHQFEIDGYCQTCVRKLPTT